MLCRERSTRVENVSVTTPLRRDPLNFILCQFLMSALPSGVWILWVHSTAPHQATSILWFLLSTYHAGRRPSLYLTSRLWAFVAHWLSVSYPALAAQKLLLVTKVGSLQMPWMKSCAGTSKFPGTFAAPITAVKRIDGEVESDSHQSPSKACQWPSGQLGLPNSMGADVVPCQQTSIDKALTVLYRVRTADAPAYWGWQEQRFHFFAPEDDVEHWNR